MPAAVTLYGYYFSSTSYRTRIALNLKGLDYDTIDIRLDRGAQLEDDFRAVNPMAAVPVLDIDGRRLVQSPAILDYLDEHYPAPQLLPTDIDQRQRVREISALIACDIHPVNNLRVLKYLRAKHGCGDDDIGSWYRHWIRQGFKPLEQMLAQTSTAQRFAVGDSVSLADVYLVPQVANARRFAVDLADYPTLAAIDAHCQQLPAFAAAHPGRHAPADQQTN